MSKFLKLQQAEKDYEKSFDNETIIYGWTQTCGKDGNIETRTASGLKTDDHTVVAGKLTNPIICGARVNNDNVKNWRYTPSVNILFWWEEPTKAEEYDAEETLHQDWNITANIIHKRISNVDNKSEWFAKALSHGKSFADTTILAHRNMPSFKDYLKYINSPLLSNEPLRPSGHLVYNREGD